MIIIMNGGKKSNLIPKIGKPKKKKAPLKCHIRRSPRSTVNRPSRDDVSRRIRAKVNTLSAVDWLLEFALDFAL